MSNEVTCSICGKTVHKRKTLHIGDGKRACREHEGVQEMAAEQHAKIVAQHQATTQRLEKKQQRRDRQYDLSPRCGVCDNKGLPEEQFYSRLLVENEKYTLKTGKTPNLFNPQEAQEAKGSLKGVRCLLRVGLADIKKKSVRLTPDAWQVAQLLHMSFVCADCMAEKGIERQQPKIEWDQLKNMTILYETFIRPKMKEQAQKELDEEK